MAAQSNELGGPRAEADEHEDEAVIVYESSNRAVSPTYESYDHLIPSRQSPAVGLVIVAVTCGAYLAWQCWKKWRGEDQGAKRSKVRKAAAKSGGRSPFSFGTPKPSGQGQPGQSSSRSLPNTSNAHHFVGNAKKDKALRRARKAERKARKQQGTQDTQVDQIIATHAKNRGVNKEGEPVRYSYVDFDKNEEAFHHVREYNETGKKVYRKVAPAPDKA